VDLDQWDATNDPASGPWGIVVSNPGTLAAVVTVTRNDAAPGAPLSTTQVAQETVSGGTTHSLVLPTRELDCGTAPNDAGAPGTCLSSRAYRVSSSMPVVVQQFNTFENSYSNDASLLLPTSALGRTYRVLGWQPAHPIPINISGLIVDRSYVTIVGTEPDTVVTVDAAWRIRGNAPIAAVPAGGTLSVTLGPYDVLNLETDDATMEDDATAAADLSGSAVSATKPIAVFSGAETSGVPGLLSVPTFPGWGGEACCNDHLEEQLFPLEVAGSRWVLPRSPVRSTGSWHEPDVIRFVGGARPAMVTTSLPAPFAAFTLEAGEVRTTSSQVAAVISSDAPIVVGQLLVSQGYVEGASLGDPSLVLLPPVEQYLSDYFLLAPVSWGSSWVVLLAPAGEPVTIDDLEPVDCASEGAGTIEGVAWESRACPLLPGAHRLQAAAPFGAIQYGYGTAGSYALLAGVGAARP
jgi:hypothetical protein